jgi:quinol monooxygenase YgiN
LIYPLEEWRREAMTTITTITTDKSLVTLINVFTVSSENQQRLVDLLVEATQRTMRNQPGYLSANIHKSLDGTRVTNYAQWRSQADFEAIEKNPEVAVHMRAALQLATSFEPHLYEVSFIDTVASPMQRSVEDS